MPRRCNTLQNTSTYWNTLTRYNTLQHASTHCSTLRRTLQHTAAHTATHTDRQHLHLCRLRTVAMCRHCNTLQHANALQHTATHTSRRVGRLCLRLCRWRTTSMPRHCNTLQHTNAQQHTVPHAATRTGRQRLRLCRSRTTTMPKLPFVAAMVSATYIETKCNTRMYCHPPQRIVTHCTTGYKLHECGMSHMNESCHTRMRRVTRTDTLLHTEIHCNTPMYYNKYVALLAAMLSATHCNTLQHTAAHCSTLQHTATHQWTATHN